MKEKIRGGSGKMSKIIKRSLVIMMILGVMGCGQQVGKEKGKSLNEVLIDVGRSAENVFYSFLELVSGSLGFTVTKDTKKSDVGDYFSSLGKKIASASVELEQVAVKVTADIDKDGILNKTVRSAVDSAKRTLEILKGHLDSLKDIGDDNKVVEVVSNQQGVAANTEKLKRAYNALKGIVDTAGGAGVDKLKESSVTLASNVIGVNDGKNGAKVLAAGADSGSAVGEKAALIVSAVRGEEMLASIVKSAEGDAAGTISSDVTKDTSALKFAVGGSTADHLAKDVALAGSVSGGIAMRALVKGGKLAAKDNNDEKAVQSVGISAVNKLLVAVEDIIKKTVKNVIEKVKQEVDKARAPRPEVKK
ncbi:variable large family protein [Borrelia persica]|uniref:variable large family protein n=1 Tax=Borrelia persica TaxID=44448 RepID=UPI0004673328|nr:variable large family protein [Borrelia persica]